MRKQRAWKNYYEELADERSETERFFTLKVLAKEAEKHRRLVRDWMVVTGTRSNATLPHSLGANSKAGYPRPAGRSLDNNEQQKTSHSGCGGRSPHPDDGRHGRRG